MLLNAWAHHQRANNEVMFGLILQVIDGENVLVKIMNPVRPDEYFALIYVWHKAFASELRDRFLELWEAAEPLSIQII
ncbi:MAG: hypothetical protein ACFFAE_18510 [Candidatus Hodarchaeota archaeon]